MQIKQEARVYSYTEKFIFKDKRTILSANHMITENREVGLLVFHQIMD